jgi:hypothetical protein
VHDLAPDPLGPGRCAAIRQLGREQPTQTSIPTGVFKTSDSYINIATTGGNIWERCAQVIGAPISSPTRTYATGPVRSRTVRIYRTE